MEGENLSKAIGENPPEQNPDGPTDQEPIPETPAKINTEEKTGADESKEIVQKNDSIPEPSNPQPTEPQPVITTTPKTEEQVASPLKKLGIQDFDLLTILGKGSFGEVTLARKKDSQKLYAMKIIDKVFLYREKKQYQVFSEKEVLRVLNHPNVIKMFYAFQDQTKLYFALEYAPRGKLPVDVLRFYAAEIINILEYLHSHGIVHRDLKPNNLMMGDDLHLKVIDFGTAKFFEIPGSSNELYQKMLFLRQTNDKNFDSSRKQRASFVGTSEFVSPELLEENITGPSADLWALGCIMYQMATGNLPFTAENEYFIFENIKAGIINWPEGTSEDLKDIVQRLLVRDPNERLGSGPPGSPNDYSALKGHKFFAGIDFANLLLIDPPKMPLVSPLRNAEEGKKEDSQETGRTTMTSNQSQQTGDFKMNDETLKNEGVVFKGILSKKANWVFYKDKTVYLFDNPPRLEFIAVEDESNPNVQRKTIKLDNTVKVEFDGKEKCVITTSLRSFTFRETNVPIHEWVTKISSVIKSQSNEEQR